MSTTTILLLQSLLITLQMLNAGLSGVVHNPVVSLMLGAIVGGFQFFVQNVGNKTLPDKNVLPVGEVTIVQKDPK